MLWLLDSKSEIYRRLLKESCRAGYHMTLSLVLSHGKEDTGYVGSVAKNLKGALTLKDTDPACIRIRKEAGE